MEANHNNTMYATYDSHKILDYITPPMSQGCGYFQLGLDKSVKIIFDEWGADIGCKRITAAAMDKLLTAWADWQKRKYVKVIQ